MHTKVHEWLWQALQTASGLNPRVLLPHPHVASICTSHGNTMPITNSTTGYQLYFALVGCQPGKQHYRYNTPHALRNSSQLLCPFCKGNSDEWREHKRRCIPKSELVIMHMLMVLQLDASVCWQVMVDFWAAPVDFKFINQALIIQADGSCHFSAMYDSTTGQQLADDLRFCASGYKAGASIVRVHALELSNKRSTSILQAALSIAVNKCCIVLSPGYTTVCMYEAGGFVTYAQLLADMLPDTIIAEDALHNIIICSR